MDKYTVEFLPKAYRDVEQIYEYISEKLIVPETAENMLKSIEDAIFSLEEFPNRGSERKVGIYANRRYRQLFIKNFAIIYRVVEEKKYVIVVTVRYTPSHF